MKYLTRNEISIDRNHWEDAMALVHTLMNEGYVCLLSYEESLIIINYEWSPNDTDRNDMVFITREDYEEEIFKNSLDNDDEM